MNLTAAQADLVGGVVAFFFTVALLSYLIGDNPLYRVALHLFVGVAAGYAALVVMFQVLTPRLITPMLGGDLQPETIVLLAVPLVLSIFLILKIHPRTAPLGNISVGYLVGVGAAVAVGGAVTGTLFPQISMAWNASYDQPSVLLNRFVIVVGAVTTLLYFQFWLRGETATGAAERAAPMRVLAEVGKGFLVLTLGAIYGGMILSGIAIFSDRMSSLVGFVQGFMP
jgi:hypothetical protein